MIYKKFVVTDYLVKKQQQKKPVKKEQLTWTLKNRKYMWKKRYRFLKGKKKGSKI